MAELGVIGGKREVRLGPDVIRYREAAERFPDFRRPVLIVWGTNDIFFLARYARRLQEDFPDARLRFLAGSRAFVPEDRPEALAGHVADFVQRGSEVGIA